ncbi:MAG: hypothetical protein BYD32DRAFT_467400 [Podila humilis]|nr:MAG: hypothetical protein BYD32DRAFT_467400 [Podila humilis]
MLGRPDFIYIALLNYPYPEEQWIYSTRATSACNLALPLIRRSPIDTGWNPISQTFSIFHDKTISTTLSNLQATLSKHGQIGIADVNINQGGWSAVFNLQDTGFIELQMRRGYVPTNLPISDSLLRLTVEDTDSMDFQFVEKLDHLVHTNQRLQELNIVVQEVNILCLLKAFLKMWDKHPSCLRLTLLERTTDKRGRIIAQIATGGRGVDASDINIRDASPKNQIRDTSP